MVDIVVGTENLLATNEAGLFPLIDQVIENFWSSLIEPVKRLVNEESCSVDVETRVWKSRDVEQRSLSSQIVDSSNELVSYQSF